MRDELHTHDLVRVLTHLIDGFCHFDATTLAATAGMDLRFNDPHWTA